MIVIIIENQLKNLPGFDPSLFFTVGTALKG
jgi:hypothetical protein